MLWRVCCVLCVQERRDNRVRHIYCYKNDPIKEKTHRWHRARRRPCTRGVGPVECEGLPPPRQVANLPKPCLEICREEGSGCFAHTAKQRSGCHTLEAHKGARTLVVHNALEAAHVAGQVAHAPLCRRLGVACVKQIGLGRLQTPLHTLPKAPSGNQTVSGITTRAKEAFLYSP